MKRHGVASLILVALIGCSGGGPKSEYCQMLQVACQRQVDCGAIVVNQASTVDDCMKGCDDGAAVVANASIALRSDAVQACSDAIAQASCTTLANKRLQPVAACADLYVGTLGAGQPCTANTVHDECADGYACTPTGGTDARCGTCQPHPPKITCHEGECGAGQFCDFGTCLPQAQLGAACQLLGGDNLWDHSCVDGAACGLEGKCVASIAAGGSCDEIGQPYVCQDSLACIDNSCVAQHGEGESCSTYSDCAVGLACSDSVCRARAGTGGACTDWAGACVDGDDCVNGTCQVHVEVAPPLATILRAGALCGASVGGICPLGTACLCDAVGCAQMHCATPLPLGASCKPAGDGMVTKEDPFNPFRCGEGMCDFVGNMTCVQPQLPGGACDYEDLSQTFECSTLLCEHKVCLDLADAMCH
jgi:hypothetical protein